MTNTAAAIEEKDFKPGPDVEPDEKNTAATVEVKDFKPGPEVEPKVTNTLDLCVQSQRNRREFI